MSIWKIAIELIDPTALPQPKADQDALDAILTEVYIGIGAIGFILILIGGFRYVMSQGDPAKITQAKNIILYTLIGIIVSALAVTIVSFVLEA